MLSANRTKMIGHSYFYSESGVLDSLLVNTDVDAVIAAVVGGGNDVRPLVDIGVARKPIASIFNSHT